MPKMTPTLWFNYNAEEAVGFWTSLLPDSRVDDVILAPSDNPSMEKGAVLAITFTLAGQTYNGINGGPQFPFSEVLSFAIACDDQAEVDRYWDALLAGGGQPSQCGWLKDRFGFSWQVVPRRLYDLMRDSAECENLVDTVAGENVLDGLRLKLANELMPLHAA